MNTSKLLKSIFLLSTMFILSGCATLEYTGEDYNVNNTETVKTVEELVFSTYKKSNGRINLKVGVSKTPVPEILALYVKVDNLSYETPYTFEVSKLQVQNPDSSIQFITSSNYLSIWNAQEASSMSAMSSMSNSIQTMTGMNTNYNDFNQSIVQNAAEQSNKSAFSRLETIGNQISKHSIKHSATISPRRSQYFYFFFEDLEKYPITVNYENLNYQFML